MNEAPLKMDRKGLSGNQLKLIALVAMTCDHVGALLIDFLPLRIIGRISFPIFAYMIAEGCAHTHSRKRYLLNMAALALVCQMVGFIASGSLAQCVLVTFTASIALIYLLNWARSKQTVFGCMAASGALCGVFFLCEVLPGLLNGTDFSVEYGFCGVMLPLMCYIGKDKREKLLLFSLGTAALRLNAVPLQWFGMGAIALMAFYNGCRGKWRMKGLFYIYYPAHLAVIWLIGLVI